jgi:para-nitrobenzyl esterase
MFARAVIESAQCVPYGRALRALRGAEHGESAEAQGVRLAHALGCDGDDAAKCLRGKSVADMLRASPAGVGFFSKGEHYSLAVDGVALDHAPRDLLDAGKLADVPTLLGTTTDEATLFTSKIPIARAAGYEALVMRLFPGKAKEILATYAPAAYSSPKAAFDALVTDLVFGCPTRHAARKLRARQAHVYRYLFAHVTEHVKYKALGATHGTEIPYVFGTVVPSPTDDERALSRAMLGYWTHFARSGDPNFAGAPKWPAYDGATDAYLELQTPIAARDHLHAAACDTLDAIGPAAAEPAGGE